jgi:cobalt-zinc-cadmium efflux system outer membrane protein
MSNQNTQAFGSTKIGLATPLALLCLLLACARVVEAAGPPASRLERLPAVETRVATVDAMAGASFPVKQASAQADAPPSHLTADEQEMLHELEAIPQGLEEPGVGMTLDDVSSVAMQNSPVILEAQLEVTAARGRAFQASRYPNPTFGSAAPQLAGNQSQYNAYVIQDYVTKGKIGLDTNAAERAAQAAEFALVRARFDVLTTVRTRFYNVLAMQQRVHILESMVSIAHTSHDVSEKLLKAGVGTRGDVLLLQIEMSRAEAELRNARILTETSKRQLAAATGLYDLQIDRVAANLLERLPDYDVIAVQQGVLARNALVQRANVEIARTQFVLRRAEVEPFPNLNMMGGWQNQQPGALAPTTQALYQMQMVIPLWNRNQGNIRAAQANVGGAVAGLGRVRNELANNAAAAIGRYLTARQLVERYETAILPSAVELQDISARLYKEGQIDFLRYLNSQRALLDASLAYIDSQEARWAAAAEVAGLLQSERFP